MSPARLHALREFVPRYAVEVPYPGRLPVVEIGCGRGDATAAMAIAEPVSPVIACDPNAAMIANLARLLVHDGIVNVRLWVGDAFDLFELLGKQSVGQVRVWFPDPWPKPGQAGKRLITAQRLAVIADALAVGGILRLATDDISYAEQALQAIAADPRLDGSVVARPPERPITVFEARALRDGRAPIDIAATRTG